MELLSGYFRMHISFYNTDVYPRSFGRVFIRICINIKMMIKLTGSSSPLTSFLSACLYLFYKQLFFFSIQILSLSGFSERNTSSVSLLKVLHSLPFLLNAGHMLTALDKQRLHSVILRYMAMLNVV